MKFWHGVQSELQTLLDKNGGGTVILNINLANTTIDCQVVQNKKVFAFRESIDPTFYTPNNPVFKLMVVALLWGRVKTLLTNKP